MMAVPDERLTHRPIGVQQSRCAELLAETHVLAGLISSSCGAMLYRYAFWP
jgi:hypothetical protein